ncbi:YdeI/OmpD-associated family protein [Aurantibacter crassamenti]|uniref:YdeI/OmpD-associated family protein n=1 Tax=Aurantibacter crassamenti TaxID=1837375 RepID=UPI0019394713|nr:YdeI/OmpD-associated family protein [Aurantibacter crassamenti]MBM1106391.1 YdeI/OmpD-associated family protein [Aurantibacter crassamenti]
MDYSEKVEAYYNQEHQFAKGIQILREIALKANAEEFFKWQAPVYGIDGKNVFWIARFKNHFGIGFFNGVFLSDPKKVLINVQKGTKAMRHWHFKSVEEIDEIAVLNYIKESIENQKKGLVLAPVKKKKAKIIIPKLLKDALVKNTVANKNFKSLTPYKQKEYTEYIAQAKQEKTKLSRLEKIIPMLEAGKGLNDRYR